MVHGKKSDTGGWNDGYCAVGKIATCGNMEADCILHWTGALGKVYRNIW
jgi:hypothetical protein